MKARELFEQFEQERREKLDCGGTKTHIAQKQGEIDRHGEHIDLVDRTSFGSHQTRVNPAGDIADQDINFSNRHTPGTKVGKYTCGADGLPIRGYNDSY